MSEHERIFLSPQDEADPEFGREWCHDDGNWESPGVEFIRIDLHEAARAAIEAYEKAKEPEASKPDLSPEFFDWLKSNRDMLNKPVLTSLLYDINLLPEQVMHFKDRKSMSYLVAVVEHFRTALGPASE